MGVRAPEAEPDQPARVSLGPPALSAVLLGLAVLFVLNANGRPIGSGDARPTERVAASLLGEGDLDLDEFGDVEEPFAREVGARKVSIYPVASAVLAVPVFAAAGGLFALDETGLALAGKWAATLFAAVAAALFFVVVGRRHPSSRAAGVALVLGLGTSVWSTSQALWQHPLAVAALCAALLCLSKAEQDAAWAARAGLPLALVVAARHADAVLVAVLVLAIAVRWPRRVPLMVAWGAPVIALVALYQWSHFGSPLRHGFSASLSRFSEPWGTGHAGLLLSPGKGLLVFTPIVIPAVAGLVVAARAGERWLALSAGAAALAHWGLMGRWSEWHGGECFGPRLMTDALPLLLLFLADAWERWPVLAGALAAWSVAVQGLGAFAYDYAWERVHQRPVSSAHPELWDVGRSPILFHARRRVVYIALPARVDGRVFVREHPLVLFDDPRSIVRFAGDGVAVQGEAPLLEDVHLQRGARVVEGRARLAGRWDGVFVRVAERARARPLELRIRGSGRGTLYVGERTFWSQSPRWATYPVAGAFRVRHPYFFPTSGGADLTITLGKSPGEVDIEEIEMADQERRAVDSPHLSLVRSTSK